MKVNIREARSRLSQLIKRAQAGEEVLIAKRGVPVARLALVPLGGSGTHGSGRDSLEWLAANPLPLRARCSSAEIDASIEAERRSSD